MEARVAVRTVSPAAIGRDGHVRRGSPPPTPADRADDRQTLISGVAKPPVLSRATLRALCVICLLVIAYGTLGPLGSSGQRWVVPVDDWHWIPGQQSSDINDLVTNLAVYIPVGIAFRLLIRRRGRSGWYDLLVAVVLSVGLSYVTELLQQFMPARSSSLMDVFVNGAAAFTGCLLAVSIQRVIRRLHTAVFVHLRHPWAPWTVMAGLAVLTTVMLMTIPWNISRPSAELGFDHALSVADLRRFVMFVAVGFLVAGAGIARSHGRGIVILAAGVGATLLALGLEAAQSVLGAHVCSLLHGIIGVSGCWVGCVGAAAMLRPRQPRPTAGESATLPDIATGMADNISHHPSSNRTDRLRMLAFLGLVALTGYAAVSNLCGGIPEKISGSGPLVRWVPFQAHFAAPFSVAVADALEQVTIYGLVTVLCLFLARGRGRAAALLLLTGLVGSIEAGRALLGPHGADTTAPLLALLSWLVATRMWMSIYPTPSSALARTSPR